jgi:hypothetical protein
MSPWADNQRTLRDKRALAATDLSAPRKTGLSFDGKPEIGGAAQDDVEPYRIFQASRALRKPVATPKSSRLDLARLRSRAVKGCF